MERFPAGIDKKGFFQKNLPKGSPEWLERVEVPKKDGTVCHPVINDARALEWLANQNCVTPHVWASRLPDLERIDVCVVDLDPPGDDPSAIRRAALATRALLDELELPSWVKTTGSKGYHVVVPIDPAARLDEIYTLTYRLAALLVKRNPELLTEEFIKADRHGRVLVDIGRNHPGATFAAPYAVRPKRTAPVSAPCTWEEIEGDTVTPSSCTLRGMGDRIARVGELWADLYDHPVPLDGALDEIRAGLSDEDWQEASAARRRRPRSRKTK
jgi:bifunctional non-homologous end joining protein LigD